MLSERSPARERTDGGEGRAIESGDRGDERRRRARAGAVVRGPPQRAELLDRVMTRVDASHETQLPAERRVEVRGVTVTRGSGLTSIVPVSVCPSTVSAA